MERLTKIIDLHNALPLSTVDIETKTNEPCVCGYAIDVLAAYEDTGLTPGEVKRISNVLQNVGEEYNCQFEFVEKCLTEKSDLIQQLEAEKNKRVKIQYKYHEYTISQLCSRMDKLEHLLKLAMRDIAHLATETVELKKKLGVAANPEKLKNGRYDVCTAICRHAPCCCFSSCDGCCDKKQGCQFEWRYADEAKELLK